jgi:protocatechuate 3,4-dioxygenase beta subunit
VKGPAIATKVLEVMTRAAEPVVGSRTELGPGPRIAGHERPVYLFGASFDYVAVASRLVRGVVRDKDTGKPLSGVRINALTSSDRCEAVTDKKGYYELVGLPKSQRLWLQLTPADGLHFERHEILHDAPGLDPLKGDIEMMGGGVTVRGKVTDSSGKPVAQVQLEYRPLYPNKYVNPKLAGTGAVIHSTALSGSDGSYTLTVLPGPGVIGVRSPNADAYMPAFVSREELKKFFKTPLIHKSPTMIPPGEEDQFLVMSLAPNFQPQAFAQADYHALVLVEPDADEKTLVKNVQLEAPRELKGRVVGPDGQPLTGVTVKGLTRGPNNETLKGADFTVRGLNPRAKRPLLFYHKERNLGFFVKDVSGEKPDTLTVKLQPCGSASGRVVDHEGNPVAEVPLAFIAARFGHDWRGDANAVTDKEGRFRVKGLVGGIEYQVLPRKGPINPIVAQVAVEPGKDKDMGDVKLPNFVGRQNRGEIFRPPGTTWQTTQAFAEKGSYGHRAARGSPSADPEPGHRPKER